MTARTRAPRCPTCGTAAARPIIYGFPTPELFENPDFALGGCIVTEEAPRYRCRNDECVTEFG